MRSSQDIRRGFVWARSARAVLAVVLSLTLIGSVALAQQAPPKTPPQKSAKQPPSQAAPGKAAPGKAPPGKAAPSAPKTTAQPEPTAKAPPAKPPAKVAAPAQAPPAKKPAPPPAPKYDERPIDENLSKQARQIRNEIQKMLRDGNIPADQVQKFEDYYKKYALARWTSTQVDEETGLPLHLANLPEYRKDLRNEFRFAKQSAVHDRLIALALAYLTEIAKNENSETGGQEKYHPAARYNAMLAVGDLNQQEASSPLEMPTPLPEALPVLVEAFSDANQHDAVRAAALLGIRRHALLDGIAAGEVPNIQALMLPLAESQVDPNRSLPGHLWMRARAIEVLAALEDVGANNAMVLSLAAIVGEEDGPLLPRRAAARAIGSFTYPANNGLDASGLATGLGQLAVDACEAELVNIEQEKLMEQRKKRRTGPGYSRGFGGYGGYGGYDDGMEEDYGYEPEEEDYDEDYDEGYPSARREEKKEEEDTTLINRRRLLTYLNAVFFGLTGKECKEWAEWKRKAGDQARPDGVAGLATAPPDEPFVTALLERIESLSELCGGKTKEDFLGKKEKDFTEEEIELPQKDAFRQRLENELAQLQGVLKTAPAAATGQPAAGS